MQPLIEACLMFTFVMSVQLVGQVLVEVLDTLGLILSAHVLNVTKAFQLVFS